MGRGGAWDVPPPRSGKDDPPPPASQRHPDFPWVSPLAVLNNKGWHSLSACSVLGTSQVSCLLSPTSLRSRCHMTSTYRQGTGSERPSDLHKVTRLLSGGGCSFQAPRPFLPLPSPHVPLCEGPVGPLVVPYWAKPRTWTSPGPGANSMQVCVIWRLSSGRVVKRLLNSQSGFR